MISALTNVNKADIIQSERLGEVAKMILATTAAQKEKFGSTPPKQSPQKQSLPSETEAAKPVEQAPEQSQAKQTPTSAEEKSSVEKQPSARLIFSEFLKKQESLKNMPVQSKSDDASITQTQPEGDSSSTIGSQEMPSSPSRPESPSVTVIATRTSTSGHKSGSRLKFPPPILASSAHRIRKVSNLNATSSYG